MNALQKLVLGYVRNNESLKAAISNDKFEEAFIKLQRETKYLTRIEVKQWRDAHQLAIDIDRPMYADLMDTYDDSMLDPHQRTVANSRFLNVLNIPAEVYDLDTGETDDDLTGLILHRWFYQATRLMLESIGFGYSPLQFHFREGKDLRYEVSKVTCVPREHIVPDWNAIRIEKNSDELVYFDDPKYSKFYVLIDSGDLGVLLNASRFTIFKKNAINHWSRYKEIYGIPPRTATTNSRDNAVWDKLERQLKEMGNSMSAVLPEGTEFKVHEMTAADPFNIFLQAAKYADEQISKLWLGQTMTTDNGSSKSQSEVHERTGDNYTKADVRLCEHHWNDRIFPLLIEWGYPLEGKGLRFNMSSKLKLAETQLEIDTWISQNFEIDESYIEETYGTPVSGRRENSLPGSESLKEDSEKKQ